MKKFKFTIRGNEYETRVLSFENDQAEIEVNGTLYTVDVHVEKKTVQKTPKLVRAKVPAPGVEGIIAKTNQVTKGFAVKAPLPGTIVKVMVKEGDVVKLGDKLLVMEAMKMENDVLAEKAGAILKVNIKEGQVVLQNELLVEIQ